MAVTTIQLRPQTRKMLKSIAVKGETYDDVINELIAGYYAYIDEQLRKLEEDEFVPAEEVFSEIEAALSQRRGKGAEETL
jgi:predicted transcriptional regulator